MKQWYSAHELAGLPGLPASPQNVTRKAKVEHWKSQPRFGRGGGQEYAYTSLPRQTQTVLIEQDRQAVQSALPRIDSPAFHRVQTQIKTTIEQRTDAWLAIPKAYESWRDSNVFPSKLRARSSICESLQGSTAKAGYLGLCLPAETFAEFAESEAQATL